MKLIQSHGKLDDKNNFYGNSSPKWDEFLLFKKHQPASDERSKIFAYNIVQILYRPYETTYAKIDNKMKS